jgi:hypothetical protein
VSRARSKQRRLAARFGARGTPRSWVTVLRVGVSHLRTAVQAIAPALRLWCERLRTSQEWARGGVIPTLNQGGFVAANGMSFSSALVHRAPVDPEVAIEAAGERWRRRLADPPRPEGIERSADQMVQSIDWLLEAEEVDRLCLESGGEFRPDTSQPWPYAGCF